MIAARLALRWPTRKASNARTRSRFKSRWAMGSPLRASARGPSTAISVWCAGGAGTAASSDLASLARGVCVAASARMAYEWPGSESLEQRRALGPAGRMEAERQLDSEPVVQPAADAVHVAQIELVEAPAYLVSAAVAEAVPPALVPGARPLPGRACVPQQRDHGVRLHPSDGEPRGPAHRSAPSHGATPAGRPRCQGHAGQWPARAGRRLPVRHRRPGASPPPLVRDERSGPHQRPPLGRAHPVR